MTPRWPLGRDDGTTNIVDARRSRLDSRVSWKDLWPTRVLFVSLFSVSLWRCRWNIAVGLRGRNQTRLSSSRVGSASYRQQKLSSVSTCFFGSVLRNGTAPSLQKTMEKGAVPWSVELVKDERAISSDRKRRDWCPKLAKSLDQRVWFPQSSSQDGKRSQIPGHLANQ